jgi:hypothetical protein
MYAGKTVFNWMDGEREKVRVEGRLSSWSILHVMPEASNILLPNPGGIRDHLVMEVDLKHTKAHDKRPKK